MLKIWADDERPMPEGYAMSVKNGVRDPSTKREFLAYLDKYPEQRFFQAIVNFTREHTTLNCWSLGICEEPGDAEGLRDVFYIEGDKVLKR